MYTCIFLVYICHTPTEITVQLYRQPSCTLLSLIICKYIFIAWWFDVKHRGKIFTTILWTTYDKIYNKPRALINYLIILSFNWNIYHDILLKVALNTINLSLNLYHEPFVNAIGITLHVNLLLIYNGGQVLRIFHLDMLLFC